METMGEFEKDIPDCEDVTNAPVPTVGGTDPTKFPSLTHLGNALKAAKKIFSD